MRLKIEITLHRLAFGLFAGFSFFVMPVSAVPAPDTTSPPTNLASGLEVIRMKLNLPGLAATVMRGGVVIAEGAVGVRRLGVDDKIQPDDRFGIGSCTKRMTGLMIGRLVDEGKLSFDTKLSSLLPEIPMREEYRDVTVAQLLAFTGGIATYERIGPKITPILFDTSGTQSERETRFVKHLLQEAPLTQPGKESHYSNASYMLAGFIATRVTGKDYAVLMDEYVFRPLGLIQTGWSRPSTPARPAQPWFHLQRPDGYVAEPDVIRPPEVLFRAAGNAHMSVRDLARFGNYELAAHLGKDPLLKPATSQRWLSFDAHPTQDRFVYAGGTPWLSACYAVWPKKDLVAAVAVNGGSMNDEACKAFVLMVQDNYAG